MRPDSSRSLLTAFLAAMLAAGVAAHAETITIEDENGSGENSEDTLVNDTYARSNDEFRGRFSDKLYVANQYDGRSCVSALRFNGLETRIGEKKTILKATLRMLTTNASGPKPIEVIAYPFIEDWSYDRFSWSKRLYDGKTLHTWNADPQHINVEPADSTDADVAVYDFAKTHKGKTISAYGHREGTDVTTIAEGSFTEFDVTDIVKLWYAGELPNHGWAFVAPNPENYIRFWATNGEGAAPKLVVEVQ